MKKCVFLLIFALLSVCAHALSYTIHQSPYLFSTYFEMHGKERYEGRVVRSHFRLRTAYDLYAPSGEYEARGVCQILSLGLFYAWAKDIDVYDALGERIGFIDGQLLTTTSAKYSFYDRHERLIANAYLDSKCSGFTVMTPEERTIARLKRHFIFDDIDSWEISVYEPALLDPRMIKVFSAFAIDFQGEFKEDL